MGGPPQFMSASKEPLVRYRTIQTRSRMSSSAASVAGATSSGARGAYLTMSVDAVRRIVRALRVAAQRTHGEAGISAAQLFVLQQLEQAPARSLGALAARTMTDRSSVADVVERLAERALVQRAPNPDDRRRMTISLTAAGRRLLRSAPPSPTSLLIAALAELDDASLAALAHGLEELTERMGIAGEEATMLFDET